MGLFGARNTPGRRAPICPDGHEQRPRQPKGALPPAPKEGCRPPEAGALPPCEQGLSAASGRSFLGASGSLAVLSWLELQGGVGRVAEGGTAAAAQEAPPFLPPTSLTLFAFPSRRARRRSSPMTTSGPTSAWETTR